MKNYGFIRIASACPLGRVGDVMYNTTEICNLIDQAVNQQVSLLVFPELSISSYTCGDLLLTSAMRKGVEQAISTEFRTSILWKNRLPFLLRAPT